jgi:hypothetical protein
MREWAIDYSLKMGDGDTKDGRFSVTADDIQEALEEGYQVLMNKELEDEDIFESAIWAISLANGEVF